MLTYIAFGTAAFFMLLFIASLLVMVHVTKKNKLAAAKLTEENKDLKQKLANPIAEMKTVELDTYLESIMMMLLQIDVSLYGSERNPDIKPENYSRVLVEFNKYLGDTWVAIEEKYGSGYLTRWYDKRYKMMELNGVIDKLIKNPPYSSTAKAEKETIQRLEAMARLGSLGMQIGKKKDEA